MLTVAVRVVSKFVPDLVRGSFGGTLEETLPGYYAGEFSVPDGAACLQLQDCELLTEVWLMWPSTLSSWSLDTWKHVNSTAGIYTFSTHANEASNIECMWANRSPHELGITVGEHCSLGYTKEGVEPDAFSIWCPLTSQFCQTKDEHVVKKYRAALNMEAVSSTLAGIWQESVLNEWGRGVFDTRQMRLLPEHRMNLVEIPFCGPAHMKNTVFNVPKARLNSIATGGPDSMPQMSWEKDRFSWVYSQPSQRSYARIASESLKNLQNRFSHLVLVGDSTMRQVAQHVSSITGLRYGVGNCQGFAFNCYGTIGSLAVDYTFGHLSLNPKGNTLDTFFGPR